MSRWVSGVPPGEENETTQDAVVVDDEFARGAQVGIEWAVK